MRRTASRSAGSITASRNTAGRRIYLTLAATVTFLVLLVGTQGQAAAQAADDPGQVEAGQAVYEMSCAGCHAADGTGVAGLGRPLTGIAGQGDRATHVASITDGKGNMPAFGDRLSADEIESATSYVRLTFVEAAVADAPAELAVTGVSTAALALVGAVMIAGGLQLVRFGNRREH